jgi:hypothetical protein
MTPALNNKKKHAQSADFNDFLSKHVILFGINPPLRINSRSSFSARFAYSRRKKVSWESKYPAEEMP